MKKVLVLVPFMLFLCFTNYVYAECDYETQAKINNAAGAVRAEYETFLYENDYYDETYGEYVTDSYWYGLIHIYNITEDIYINVIDNNGNSRKYTIDDVSADNVIYVGTGMANEVKKYKIEVYATDSSCIDNVIRTIDISIPRYNLFSIYSQCDEYPDYYYCSEFVFLDNISEKEFYKGIEDYAKRKEEEDKEGIIGQAVDLLKNNWVPIAILVACLSAGGYIFYIKVYKRKGKKK